MKTKNTNYNQEHRIGEVIEQKGVKFTILPKSGKEKGLFKRTSTVNIRVSPVREVANTLINNLSITPKGQAKDILRAEYCK